MNLDELLRVFMARPAYQRVFFAFTLAVFMSCSMSVAGSAPEPALSAPLAIQQVGVGH